MAKTKPFYGWNQINAQLKCAMSISPPSAAICSAQICEKADPQRKIHLHQTNCVGLKGSKGFS